MPTVVRRSLIARMPVLCSTLVVLLILVSPAIRSNAQPTPDEMARQVEIIRTDYGVPHISAENVRAAGFGLGYIQMEDYGETVLRLLRTTRGDMAKTFGPRFIDSDVQNRMRHARAVETFSEVRPDVRDIIEGFAEGVNYFIRQHPDRVPEWAEPDYTAYDVAARDVGWATPGTVRRFMRLLESGEGDRVAPDDYSASGPQEYVAPEEVGTGLGPDPGSNSWALAPSRTESGNAILMRNPHLSWDAGYYEAQFHVPGVVNFYGDFRIGGPFNTVGGFNEHLGFTTTNNSPPSHEIYALEADPELADHYVFDGESVPVERHLLAIEFKNGDAVSTTVREYLTTPIGPVVHRGNGWIYVIRAGNHGVFRVGEHFYGMMTATSLAEWEEAMKVRAHPYSNFIYADGAGNIHYVWSGTIPLLPHAAGGDTLAIPARTSDDIWTELVPYESLPALTNPAGGYIHNENDPFHFTNLNEPISDEGMPDYFPEASLRLRSLHGIELLHNDRVFSLEDVVEAKHSMRMLMADRVKDDLVHAVRASNPVGDVAAALEVIERWDNTVDAEARGGVLFENWWNRYQNATGSNVRPIEQDPRLFRVIWTPDEPLHTPYGLANPEVAVEAFAEAVEETTQQWGDVAIAWGEVHRARHGGLDVPVGGCHGALGCFRTIWFGQDDDGYRFVRGGDGWTFAVEFTDVPKAYTILAYGQSNREDSPHHTDQLEMFARNEMKPVYYRMEDVRQHAKRIYHPGL